jgi:hypothetical protein
MSVNGVPVPLTTTATGARAEVPGEVAAAYGERRLVLRLTAGEADLHLLGLALASPGM